MLLGRAILSLTPLWERGDPVVLAPSSKAWDLCREEGCEKLSGREALLHFDAMDRRSSWGIRQFVVEARLTRVLPSEINDQELFTMLRDAIKTGDLIALRKSGKAGKAPGGTAEQRRLVREIEKLTRGHLNFAGRSYKLVADAELAKIPDRNSYEVVGRDDAGRVLEGVAKESGTAGNLGNLLGQASAKLTRDWRPPFQPDGLVLLRRLLARRAAVANDEPAITPSQMKKLVKQTDWIEIEVVDEDDKPYTGPYQLDLPDGTSLKGNFTGSFANHDVDPGQCKIAFFAKEFQIDDRVPDAPPPAPVVLPDKATVCRLRMFGLHFDTDKCFLLPTSMDGIQQVKAQYDKYNGYKVLIVGHADSRGEEAYNSNLSLERADSIHSFLTDQSDAWLAWYDSSKPQSKRWGTLEDQYMLSVLPHKGTPYYAGAIDGVAGNQTTKAIKSFQEDEGLTVDGVAGPKTRKALIVSYMSLDNTSLPSECEVTTHGCGEYFPEVPSDTADAKNRRVELFFFKDAITPPPPGKLSAKGSTEYPEWKASATETIDIEAGGASSADTPLWIRCHDTGDSLLTGGFCQVKSGGAVLATVAIDPQGWAKIMLPGAMCYTEVDVAWGADSEAGPFPYSGKLYVSCSGADGIDQDKRRLHNLGYDVSEFEFAVKQFQTNYLIVDGSGTAEVGLTAGGELPEFTRKKLDQIFEANDCDAKR